MTRSIIGVVEEGLRGVVGYTQHTTVLPEEFLPIRMQWKEYECVDGDSGAREQRAELCVFVSVVCACVLEGRERERERERQTDRQTECR